MFYFVKGRVVDVNENLMNEVGAEGLVAIAACQDHFEGLRELIVIYLLECKNKLVGIDLV